MSIAESRPRFRATFALMLLLLSACATRPATPSSDASLVGSVEAKEMPAAPEERYIQGGNVSYSLPLPAGENPMPEYPPSLLAARLERRTFAARLIFNAKGEVVEVLPLRADTSAESAAFLSSVREACRRWYYTAMVERRRVTTDTPDGRTQSIVETPMPFRLDFQFTFAQSGGRGRVEGKAVDE